MDRLGRVARFLRGHARGRPTPAHPLRGRGEVARPRLRWAGCGGIKMTGGRATDYFERAQANATRAPPRHMPVPMRCTKSTGRMVARVGRPSMLQRLRRPKAARTKTTRKDSGRKLIDYHLLSFVDEEPERYVAPNSVIGNHRPTRRGPHDPAMLEGRDSPAAPSISSVSGRPSREQAPPSNQPIRDPGTQPSSSLLIGRPAYRTKPRTRPASRRSRRTPRSPARHPPK